MFIKVVNVKTKEINTYSVSRFSVARGDGTQVILDMVSDGAPVAVICQQGVHTIYVMNKDGRTIDTYRL